MKYIRSSIIICNIGIFMSRKSWCR